MVPAALLVFAAVWLNVGSRGGLHRLRSADRPLRWGRGGGSSWLESPGSRRAVCVAGTGALLWSVAGPVAALLAVPVGCCLSWWLGRLESPSAARAREQVDRELPLALDLLAACLEAGRPVDRSLLVVSQAVGGELARRLDLLASRLAMVSDQSAEWDRLAADPQLGRLGRTMRRAVETGAAPVAGLVRLADDQRRHRRMQTQARARSAGVRAAGPLALCFLPAFMVIGVVPTVAGALGHLLQ